MPLLRRPLSATVAAGFVALASVFAVGCPQLADATRPDGTFYDYLPSQQAGAPGSTVRTEPLDGAPLGARAWRVLYRSTGLRGEPIVVSGIVVVPAGVAPPGGRPIVAWAHPTSGVVSRCAPSRGRFVFQTMMGVRDMVRRGYVVAATDYPGLGTVGPHPYLVGDSEARSVIDSVRAARQMPEAHAGNRYAVWGHSQGGQAALFTGMTPASYAPELTLVGVAAAAPAADLETLLKDDATTDGGRNVTAMTLWSWQRVFGAPIDKVVEPAAMPTVDALSNECIESAVDVVERLYSQRPLRKSFLSVPDITKVEPWSTLLKENEAGTLPPALPVMISQGGADLLVLPAVTRAYVARLCAAGSRVSYLELPGVHHGSIGSDSALAAVSWMADRFDGKPVPSTCEPASH